MSIGSDALSSNPISAQAVPKSTAKTPPTRLATAKPDTLAQPEPR